MNPLEKMLTKRGKSSIKEGEAIVNDVKLLLDNNAQEEIATLKSIGLDMDLRFAESKKEDIIIRSKANTKLERQILHIKEIKKFCLDYRLYMKPAREYAGRIPNDLGAELTRYCKEKGVVLTGSSSYSNFFIIAPPKMFAGYSSPGEVFLNGIDYTMEEAAERRRLKEQDPILVYKLPDNPNYYAVIKSWGSDFTPLRRIYGILTQRKWFKRILFTIDCLFLYAMYKLMIFQVKYFINLSNAHKGEDAWGLLAITIAILILILTGVYLFSDLIRFLRRGLIRDVTGVNEGHYKH